MAVQKSYLIIGRVRITKLFETLSSQYSITHIPTKGISRSELISQIHSLPQKAYTFALVLSETHHIAPFNKDIFETLQIECLCIDGAGYDVLDVDYFTSRGIWVANAPIAVRIPTAEWAVALILASVKGLGMTDKNVKSGIWRNELGLRWNLKGMTLGIVGLGEIGKEVVKRMKPWGVEIIYANRRPLPQDEEEELGARFVPLSEIWAEPDIISLHCPLTPQTRHILNAETLSQCKKGVFIVNTSRGPVIDEVALVQALKEGHVAGAGLDVFEREPHVEEELLHMDNVILSPHFAVFTHECLVDLANEVIENTLAYIEKGKPNTPVNNPRAIL